LWLSAGVHADCFGQAGSGGVNVTGPSTAGDATSGDAAIAQENKVIDKKLNSICKGC